MSKFNGVKTDNAKINAKQDLRNNIKQYFNELHVLEVYCGSGEMYRDVWHVAQTYTGIDQKKQFDERHTICGDACKAVSVIDLDGFNVFDIDAYGSPYDVLNIILSRYQGNAKRLAFILTDGINMDLKMGRLCKGVRAMLGIDSKVFKKANNMHGKIIEDIVDKVAVMLDAKVIHREFAKGVTGAAMRYYAFVVERV